MSSLRNELNAAQLTLYNFNWYSNSTSDYDTQLTINLNNKKLMENLRSLDIQNKGENTANHVYEKEILFDRTSETLLINDDDEFLKIEFDPQLCPMLISCDLMNIVAKDFYCVESKCSKKLI